ncbi:hypothetical protein KRX57_04705 [Weeksellaceae bacterium TAE3-ERU29]|nr:hypothetical protein [Weeksellaceae bacterium TAE3-ERU29]
MIYSCNSKTTRKGELPPTKEVVVSKDRVLSYQFYNNEENINKRINSNLYKDSIFEYINRFKEVDSYTWGQCFGHFKCYAKGNLMYKGVVYEYEINAGGWIKLTSNHKEVKFLGSMNKKDTINSFLSVYYCDEDWEYSP